MMGWISWPRKVLVEFFLFVGLGSRGFLFYRCIFSFFVWGNMVI